MADRPLGTGGDGFMTKNVFVVDDDPVFCEIVRSYLHQSGTTSVAVASNGEEALATFEHSSEQIDLMVLDLHLPKFDGIQMIGRLRELKFRGPIVLVSSQLVVLRAAAALGRGYGLNILETVSKPLAKEDMDRWIGALSREELSPLSAVGH